MRPNPRALLAIIPLLMMTSVLGQETIRFIGPTGGATQAIVEDLIPAFERQTGLTVQATYIPHDSLTRRAMTEFIAGRPSFDVIMFETSWGGTYSPFMEDLEARLQDADPAYDEPDILTAARQMGIYDGKIVGLPYRVIGRMLHYRADLFAEVGIEDPPETFEQLLEYGQRLTRDTTGDGQVDVYGLGILGQQGYGNAYEFGSFLFSSGGAWWDLDACEVTFNDEAGVRALTYYADLRGEDGIVPPEVTTWGWDEWIAGGQQGRYAMAIMHTPYAVPLGDPDASQTAGKWAWADAPGWGSLDEGSPPVGGWLLGIPVGAANSDGAWQLVEFITGPSAQLMSAFNANAPTRASVFEHAEVQEMWPWADAALRSLDRGTPMYNNPEQMEAESVLMVEVSAALIGSKSPQQAADDAAAELQRILQRSGRCP
jgi:multiple sugar transport system substrate-binding protein